MGVFVISPPPRLARQSVYRSGSFPPRALCCTRIASSMPRSDFPVPFPPLPTHGYRQDLLVEISSTGTLGSLQFPHNPSLHVAAVTPPVRGSVPWLITATPCCLRREITVSATGYKRDEVTCAFTCVTTWSVAHPPFKGCCRRASPWCFHTVAPPVLRGLEPYWPRSDLHRLGYASLSGRAISPPTRVYLTQPFLSSSFLEPGRLLYSLCYPSRSRV